MTRIVLAWTTVALTLDSCVWAAETKPNIVILFADDLGYADIGANGCKDIPTPNIDSIATVGVQFTDGYAPHPACAPSRAALLSGMYPQRFGFEHNPGPEHLASPSFGLPTSIPTLAEKLKAAGYATAITGKWHVGFKEGLRPHERGFDFSYCFLGGAHTYFPGESDESIFRNGEPVEEKEYLTDAFAREAVGFIERSKDQPFFLYLSFNAVHTPLEATTEYEKRFPEISDANRKTYAGMVSAMDDAVGRVLEKLREFELEEKTLVVFYGDNGGQTKRTSSRNDPLRGFKTQLYEGGIRVPFLMQWKGKLPAGAVFREPVMGFDVHAMALSAAGIAISAENPIDGVDLTPYLTGEETGPPHESLFWRVGQQHAARVGDWKLLRSGDEDDDQLFNLKDDIGESTNLAAQHPEELKELQAIYDAWDEQMMPPLWARPTGPVSTDDAEAFNASRDVQRFDRLDTSRNWKFPTEEIQPARRGQSALRKADKASGDAGRSEGNINEWNAKIVDVTPPNGTFSRTHIHVQETGPIYVTHERDSLREFVLHGVS